MTVPRRQPLSGASRVYLLFFCLTILLSSSGSSSKPEQIDVIKMQLGRKPLYFENAVQCSLVTNFENGNKVVQKDSGSAKHSPRLTSASASCPSRHLDHMLGKVWGNRFIPVIYLQSDHVQELVNWWGCSIRV